MRSVVKEERREDVGAGKIAARVTQARGVHHPEAGAPDTPRPFGDARHHRCINMQAFYFMRHGGNLPSAREPVNDGQLGVLSPMSVGAI